MAGVGVGERQAVEIETGQEAGGELALDAAAQDQLVQVGETSSVAEYSDQEIKEAAGLAVGSYMKRGISDGSITEDQLREAYRVIQANNPGKKAMFDPSQTPGVGDSTVPIPMTSPRPSALGGA